MRMLLSQFCSNTREHTNHLFRTSHLIAYTSNLTVVFAFISQRYHLLNRKHRVRFFSVPCVFHEFLINLVSFPIVLDSYLYIYPSSHTTPRRTGISQ